MWRRAVRIQAGRAVGAGALGAGAAYVHFQRYGSRAAFADTKKDPLECCHTGAPAAGAGADDDDEDMYTLTEVKKHTGSDSLWVTYKGGVYDVTQYLTCHPGGKDLLMAQGGKDLEAIWDNYAIHKNNKKAEPMLNAMRIGKMSPRDAAQATQEGRNFDARDQRMNQIRRVRTAGLLSGAALMPLFWGVRFALRVLGIFAPPLVALFSRLLPVSVPGIGAAAPLPSVQGDGTRTKVAVVGGGISGCGAAWALAESGYDVTVYEGRPTLGGNAQTYDFPGSTKLDGLVSYFNEEYYPNYLSMLDKLGIYWDTVWLPHVCHSTLRGKDEYYTLVHDPEHESWFPQPSTNEEFKPDVARFLNVIKCVRFFNNLVTWDSTESFYKHTGLIAYLNPMNFISVHTMCNLFGVSKDFWENVLIPFDGFNYFGQDIESVPAVCMAVLEDFAPIGAPRQSLTWNHHGTSAEVFQKMTKDATVRINTRVMKVEEKKSGGLNVVDDKGQQKKFDRVIFACPASAVANAMEPSLTWLEKAALRSVQYKCDVDQGWVRAWVHQDKTAFHNGTMPAADGARNDDNMNKHCAFYLSVSPGDKKPESRHSRDVHYEWIQNAGVISGQHMPGRPCWEHPALLSFNRKDTNGKNTGSTPQLDPAKILKEVCISRSHPNIELQNFIAAQLVPLFQGRRGIYYCSNYPTCGNGHDPSLLAGFSAAVAIGADYPIDKDQPRYARARRDYERLSGSLGLAPQSKLWDLATVGAQCGLGYLLCTQAGREVSQPYLDQAAELWAKAKGA